jgi:hypothetical protein
MTNTPKLFASGWGDYELIDAGGGKKLERWGKIITIRPEVQSYFKSELPFTEWKKMAHWEFNESKGQAGFWKEPFVYGANAIGKNYYLDQNIKKMFSIFIYHTNIV